MPAVEVAAVDAPRAGVDGDGAGAGVGATGSGTGVGGGTSTGGGAGSVAATGSGARGDIIHHAPPPRTSTAATAAPISPILRPLEAGGALGAGNGAAGGTLTSFARVVGVGDAVAVAVDITAVRGRSSIAGVGDAIVGAIPDGSNCSGDVASIRPELPMGPMASIDPVGIARDGVATRPAGADERYVAGVGAPVSARSSVS